MSGEKRAAAEVLTPDLCVIGAGSAGLSVAAGAVQMGAEVVLIEKGAMGGDCLNTGCVPSKAMLAAGHAADVIRRSGRFGVNGHEPEIDFAAVNAHVKGVIAGIAPHDSVERFESLGVTVIQAEARFTAPNEVQAGGRSIRAKRFVLATGSRASLPPIPGLDEAPHLTNESIFDLTEKPAHLLVIGGGPIGAEMAQAHRRLGCRVTLLEAFAFLGKDDPEAVAVVRRRFEAEGIAMKIGVKIEKIEARGNGVAVHLAESDGQPAEVVEGSHLLVAAGRKANVENLGLEAAGIDHSPKGIQVNSRLRSSNRKVYAIGDVAGGLQFTHVAGYHAGIVIRNALFRLPAKARSENIPWVTYTDPELAQVGVTEAQAREKQGEAVTVSSFAFGENDRARAERETEGFVKVVTGRRGKVLGATIVGARAGELILPWALALEQGMKIGALASVIAPYPTFSETSKRAAGAYFTPALFGERTKKIVRLLLKLP